VSIGTSASCPRYVVTGRNSRALAEGMCALCAHSAVLARALLRVFVRACVVRTCALVVCVRDSALPSHGRRLWQVECVQVVPAGFGYLVTTYMSDGNPLPTFSGSPLLVRTLCLERMPLCVRTSVPRKL
jgi:hypothetical protein